MNPFLADKRRPLIVGHRGVPSLHQENTLAGFRRAVELGLDAVELDVRMTRDGRPVVFHDRSLERLTGVARPIAELTWDEIAKLRIRRTIAVGRDPRGERVFASYECEERISLLSEVLAELAGKLVVNIELKARWLDDGISRAVAAAIVAAGMCERVLVTSFSPRRLLEVARLDPRITIGSCWDAWAFAGALGRRLLNYLVESNVGGLRAVGAEHTLVGDDTVSRLHRRGVAIGTHVLFPLGADAGRAVPKTSTSPAEVARLASLRVDWIESDHPDVVQKLVA